MLFVTYTGVPGYRGEIFALPAGEMPIQCGWYGMIQFAADGSHILVDTGNAVEEYIPEDCGTKNPPEKVYSRDVNLFATLSPDEQYMADVRGGERGVEEYIVVSCLKTGEERNLGIGNFPIWSRDGQWLAYTGADGIYVFQNIPNAEPRLLVSLNSPGPIQVPVFREEPWAQYYPPVASWSPDGQWLAYHVYSSEPVVDSEANDWAKYYSIFKVNVRTGEMVKLIDGGYSPSWRWPAQP